MLVDEDDEFHSHSIQQGGTDTAKELLGKQRQKEKPWITDEILDFCDQSRDLSERDEYQRHIILCRTDGESYKIRHI